MITRRRFFKVAAAGTALSAGVGLYTWQIEPHWLEVVEHPLAIEHLPDELVGWRMVQLSDLHIGPQVDDAYLVRCFERVKELSPELVVYTGDFISHEPEIVAHCAAHVRASAAGAKRHVRDPRQSRLRSRMVAVATSAADRGAGHGCGSARLAQRAARRSPDCTSWAWMTCGPGDSTPSRLLPGYHPTSPPWHCRTTPIPWIKRGGTRFPAGSWRVTRTEGNASRPSWRRPCCPYVTGATRPASSLCREAETFTSTAASATCCKCDSTSDPK